eukprot:15442566-Alexandrium_andersonii.AAC.1
MRCTVESARRSCKPLSSHLDGTVTPRVGPAPLAGTTSCHVVEVARSLARPVGVRKLVCASGATDAAGVYP